MDVNKEMSKEEQIGFHKGSIATLIKEREELVRLVGIVEQLIPMHTNALKELGVDVEQELPSQEEQQPKKKKRPIEDIL